MADDVAIRLFRTGDIGMIAARQALLYAQTQGWGRGLEVNILQTCASFLQGFKAGREQCWVAELGGALAGSVFLTDEGDGVSRLRLLYVEPSAQGRGIGTRLVGGCVSFARDAEYSSMILWTHTVLANARRLYGANGFVLVSTEMHTEFGIPVQGEIWRLIL